jgi:hypothetical protein
MTHYWIDTEFLDTGSTIDLVSIGLVCEDGRELYLQSLGFNLNKANEWVQANVFPHLQLCQHIGTAEKSVESVLWTQMSDHGFLGGGCHTRDLIGFSPECPWRTREQIRDEVKAFVNAGEGKPEFIGWCSSYDHVALCQLFGTMMDIPNGWPHYITEFQQILDGRGVYDDQLPQQEEGTHNALEDARHLKKLWGYIVRNDAWQ